MGRYTQRVYTSNNNANYNSSKCDKTCGIIIGSVIGGIFGLVLIFILIFWVISKYYRHKMIKESEYRIQEMTRVDSILEKKLDDFLNNNPQILDMNDCNIPDYLKENIPNLSDVESKNAINIIAKRRIQSMSDKNIY